MVVVEAANRWRKRLGCGGGGGGLRDWGENEEVGKIGENGAACRDLYSSSKGSKREIFTDVDEHCKSNSHA